MPQSTAEGALAVIWQDLGEIMNFTDKEKIWSLKYSPDEHTDAVVSELSQSLGVSQVCARLLYNRGYRNVDEARAFLHTGIDSLHSPYLLKDMERAIARIARAVENGEKITVYGDYDVDGVTSVSLMYLYFKSVGADIDYYIPSRSKEGYGVSVAGIDTLAARKTSLMITVDTGITATAEVEYAKTHGIDTVVTDHHECYASLPDACAVVNPHRPDCEYPFRELAGVGVVFKLVCAFEEHLHPELSSAECAENICKKYIDLVAIGTVADVMPVRDENRYIVSEGIKQIADTDRAGLRALIDAASNTSGNAQSALSGNGKPKKRKINTGYIGFTLAPRINAAGRISSAQKAVELLLSDSYESAVPRAEELCEINLCRQVEENRIAEQAYKMIEQTHDFDRHKVIVLDDNSWQQGIIGIVSSRITEKFGLPSILISYDGATRGFDSPDDIGKGSGRSIKGLNLVGALGECEGLLEKFGGHELAAGLSVRRGNVALFREKINEYASSQLTAEDIKVRYEADCELSLCDATMSLASEIELLEPFGIANSTPVFLVKNLVLDRIIPLGAGNHCKIFFRGVEENISAVCFGTSASKLDFLSGESVDLLCQLGINEFRGVRSLQFIVQDIRMSETFCAQRASEYKRYLDIMGGADIHPEENVIPTRDETVSIYKFLSYEAGMERRVFSDRLLKALVDTRMGTDISYVKLRLILNILDDMKVVSVTEISKNIFEFEMIKNAQKTSIENSETYKMLVSHSKA